MLYNYIYFHMIPSPRTIVGDVSKLPPAHMLIAEQGNVIPPDLHARCRLACSHAVTNAIAAVEGLVAEAVVLWPPTGSVE